MSTQDIDLIFPSNTEISMFMECFSSLLVSLLTSWLLPTTAQVTIEAVPPIAVEGETVLLFVHNLPENVQVLSWYTGLAALKSCEIERYVIATKSHEVGPAYSSRETILRNGSLMIKSVNKKDSGYYTLKILSTTSSSEIIHAEFFVHSKSIFYELWCWVGCIQRSVVSGLDLPCFCIVFLCGILRISCRTCLIKLS